MAVAATMGLCARGGPCIFVFSFVALLVCDCAAQDTACGRDVPDPPRIAGAEKMHKPTAAEPGRKAVTPPSNDEDCHCEVHKNAYYTLEGFHGVGTRVLLNTSAE